MIRTIQITEQELKDLKLIRNYFGEHDKTPLEHLAYIELDKLVKKLQQADVSGSLQINWDDVYEEANHRSPTAFDEYAKSICNDR